MTKNEEYIVSGGNEEKIYIYNLKEKNIDKVLEGHENVIEKIVLLEEEISIKCI